MRMRSDRMRTLLAGYAEAIRTRSIELLAAFNPNARNDRSSAEHIGEHLLHVLRACARTGRYDIVLILLIAFPPETITGMDTEKLQATLRVNEARLAEMQLDGIDMEEGGIGYLLSHTSELVARYLPQIAEVSASET